MSRSLSAIALSIALLTGVLVGQLTVFGSTSSSLRPRATENQLDLVRAFYEGMNQFLNTGDRDGMQMLAPGFQDILVSGSTIGTAETLIDRLEALRQSGSPVRFVVEELRDLGGLVEVRVTLMGAQSLEVAGLPVETHLTTPALEFVQIDRKTIVARWSHDNGIPLVDHSLESTASMTPGTVLSVKLSRITLESSAEIVLPASRSGWLLVEHGEVAIRTRESTMRLGQSESRMIAKSAQTRIWSSSPTPAVFLLATLGRVEPNPQTLYGGAAAGGLPADIAAELLAWSTQYSDPVMSDLLRVRIARATFPQGVRISAHSAGTWEMLVVLDGEIETVLQEGNAMHCRPDFLASTFRGAQTVRTGEGIAAMQDAILSYRVTSATPATVLIVTIDQR